MSHDSQVDSVISSDSGRGVLEESSAEAGSGVRVSSTRRPAQLRRLGLVTYEDGMLMQSHLVGLRQQEHIPDQVLLVHHPNVFTLGRRASREHILIDEAAQVRWDVTVHESVRGGDVTYHGPGQLVVYPILSLPPARQDVGRYVRDLEEAMIRTLADYGVVGGRIPGLSGTWVGEEKIGAIGVRMSRWVTSHGLALNVAPDLRYFKLIVPCGIQDHGVTSLAQLLGKAPPLLEVSTRLLGHLAEIFGLELEPRPVDMQTIQAWVLCRDAGGLHALVLRRTPEQGGNWQPVTGRIEPGEAPEQAALREVLEETGLEGRLEPLDFTHAFMLDPQVFGPPRFPVPHFAEEHSFVVWVDKPHAVQLEAGAHDAWEWVSPEEALCRMRWSGNIEALRKVLSR